MKPEVIRTKSLVDDVVHFIVNASKQAIDENGFFRLALSGGNTPKPIYQALSLQDCAWSKWIVTFGDERCVPPDDPQSNYRMAAEAFLIVTTPGEVHRMQGELPAEEAAQEYDQVIQRLARRFGEERYRHDLILLGLGDDGHTASLFPGTAALEETSRNVVSNFVPKFKTNRLTFTYPLINAAQRVAFLVNSRDKDSVIDEILRGEGEAPAKRVQPREGELLWFVGGSADGR